ncbi:MAG: ABC transporter ATP-binding protein [Treponema sp.]|nr:ABC transporter ATP-binding protein [Treponema sp.]
MNNANILEIKDLHVNYTTDEAVFYAVNGLNLAVRKGETLGLVGETGAGKTTTALSVLRLLPERVGKITKGEIYLDEINIHDAKEGDMRALRGNLVSMIFQDPMTSLNPILTVGRQIEEVLEFHKKFDNKADISKRVDELMGLVNLPPERKDEYPHQFSGGMKQRIVIAIALACEPQLLLADEPTTALDVTIQAQVLEIMADLKKTFNMAMILITHDLGVVAETCDRVAIMYAGEIIEMGTMEDIYSGDDHHPYTIGLFGSIPDLDTRSKRLNAIDGLMPDPSNMPPGCPFHPRCPKRLDHCSSVIPDTIDKNGHLIKCHLYNKGAR